MARSKATTGPQIAAAFAELTKKGSPITVRSLRESAGVSTAAAAAWLRENRPAMEAPEIPLDEMRGVLSAFWALAVNTARDEVAQEHTEQFGTLVAAEAKALELAATVETANAELEAKVAQLQAEVQAADERAASEKARSDAELSGLQRAAAAAIARADRETETARAAEARASRAEATAETLQRIVDQHLSAEK